jgi:hypothetical protein
MCDIQVIYAGRLLKFLILVFPVAKELKRSFENICTIEKFTMQKYKY